MLYRRDLFSLASLVPFASLMGMRSQTTSPQAPAIRRHELYTLLVGQRMIDVEKIDSFDVDGFRSTIKDGINKRLGAEVIEDVLVEQIDYIAKLEVGKEPPRRGTAIVRSGEAPEAPAKLTAH